ncbi:hypothetical protein [Flavobacterium adhaerens]|uniref:hypothetical protein n=1 Tax=Flavobacterium adhaerens TaxID=3149043 RepID=UPI0032B5EF39
MKTNALISQKAPLYFLIGLIGLMMSSCGSYQNSSYYDSDGVYASNGEKVVIKDNQPSANSIQYKAYFNSLQTTEDSTDIFTDVNSYNSGYDIENDSIQAPSTGYSAWGSSPEQTTITVYPDNYWSFGFGWGYPYYGWGYPYYGWGYPYYGWGYPGYGWGYPGYGWGYPGYGYPVVSPYSYNYSRRGSSYRGGYNNTRITAYNRNNITSRNSFTNRNSVYSRNSSNNIVNRRVPTYTNRNSSSNYNVTSRNSSINQSRRNSSYTQSRTNSSYQNSQRSYTPSNNSYRSSGSSMSSGRMSSGGGGGRMSGGGGRR